MPAVRDPGGIFLRRALRAGLLAPAALAIGDLVVGDAVAALFATFGLFVLVGLLVSWPSTALPSTRTWRPCLWNCSAATRAIAPNSPLLGRSGGLRPELASRNVEVLFAPIPPWRPDAKRNRRRVELLPRV
jgi:hypothetical protein